MLKIQTIFLLLTGNYMGIAILQFGYFILKVICTIISLLTYNTKRAIELISAKIVKLNKEQKTTAIRPDLTRSDNDRILKNIKVNFDPSVALVNKRNNNQRQQKTLNPVFKQLIKKNQLMSIVFKSDNYKYKCTFQDILSKKYFNLYLTEENKIYYCAQQSQLQKNYIIFQIKAQKHFNQMLDIFNSIQKWNILTILINRCNWYKIESNLLSKPIGSIYFQNLQRISLNGMGICNIQFLSFINAPKLQQIGLARNKIVNIKSLIKYKINKQRSNKNLNCFDINLSENKIKELNFVNRFRFGPQQRYFPNFGSLNQNGQNHIIYPFDLSFIMKTEHYDKFQLTIYQISDVDNDANQLGLTINNRLSSLVQSIGTLYDE